MTRLLLLSVAGALLLGLAACSADSPADPAPICPAFSTPAGPPPPAIPVR